MIKPALYLTNLSGVYIYMKTIKLTKKQYDLLRNCFQEGAYCKGVSNDSSLELGLKTEKEINTENLIIKNIRKKLNLINC